MIKNSQKGSVLILILFIAVGTGLVLTSVSKLSIQEMRMNERSMVMLEAKSAAEATVENAFSQLVKRFDERTSFSPTALSPTNGDPVILNGGFYELFESSSNSSKSNVILPQKPYNPQAPWNSQSTEVLAGIIPPGTWSFIDSRIPGNEFDPLRDKKVLLREVVIIGKASATIPSTGEVITEHVGQNLQVRDAPLFAHAIFYNMDMEIAPGPKMDIKGAVHANGDMYVQANDELNFYFNVTATGDLLHGPFPDISKATEYGNVSFADGLGGLKSMKMGSSWLDSKVTDFRSLASNRWNGNVQSSAHGVRKHNPVAIDPYVRDNPSTHVKDDPLNYAYQLIQPPLNKSDPAYSSEVENQKFSTKAGMVIKVDTNTEKFDAYIFERDSSNKIVYDTSGNPITRELKLNSSVVKIRPFHATKKTVSSGLYDKRMQEGINIVEVNMERMKHFIEKNSNKDWGNHPHQAPSMWWNGVVYVELPTQGTTGRPDNVNPAQSGWAVKLVEGGGSKGGIPNPSYAHPKDIFGTTIATNAPLYVHGHYNADGNQSTGSANDPDTTDIEVEPPAALIGDSVTILSQDWDDKDSINSLSNRKANSFTEISAAILTGAVISDKKGGNNYSGGVENFPRFLEEWGHLRYRGSMVSLFESEVATEPWGTNDVYTAPVRDWGYHNLFSKGYYPPGTPNTRTYRRVNYKNLTAEEYQETIDQIKSQL